MFASFLLSLREGIESAIIIGIILGTLRKIDRRDLYPITWIGVACALLVSFIAAWGLNWIGAEFKGQGEQLFEGFSMLVAAGILTWMIFWMHKYSANLKNSIETNVMQAAIGQGRTTLFFVAFLVVVREGVELAFFLLAVRLTSSPLQEFSGAALGIITSVILGWIMFSSTRTIRLKQFFKITNVALIFIAAGLVGLGFHELVESGWMPAILDHIWNLEGVFPVASFTGQILQSIAGYDSSPSLIQSIAYLVYLVILGWLLLFKPNNAQREESVKNNQS